MTSGDEPMLSQSADDNAPMISRRGTKIIADARGAYLAGNFDALIKMLDEAETRYFNLGCLERLTDLAHEQMAVSTGGLSDRERRALSALYAYFRDPSSQSGDTLRTALAAERYVPFDVQDVQVRDYVIAMLGLTAMQTGSVYHAYAPILHHIIKITGRVPYREQIKAQLGLGQWKLDSAWAVLQGKTPAPYELRVAT